MVMILHINKDFIVSETGLLAIVDSHFNPHSWHIFEQHINKAVGIITDTLYNLYRKGIISIEIITKKYKIAERTVFKKHKCYVNVTTQTDPTKIIGWLENELIFELANSKSGLLKEVIHDVLNRVFKGNKRLINPGKYFLLESLKNQNCKFYSYRVVSQFKVDVKVEVWQEPDQKKLLESLAIQNNCKVVNLQIDREVVRKIVKRQLLKFQDLD